MLNLSVDFCCSIWSILTEIERNTKFQESLLGSGAVNRIVVYFCYMGCHILKTLLGTLSFTCVTFRKFYSHECIHMAPNTPLAFQTVSFSLFLAGM